MNDEQQGLLETLCSRCGAEASWRFLGEQQTVEILCPDCGRFELPRAEFEQDIVKADERLQ